MVAVLSPFKYHILTEENMVFQKMIFGCWFLSVTIKSLSFSKRTEKASFMFCFVALFVMIVYFFIAYFIIAVQIKMSRDTTQKKSATSHRINQANCKKRHLVPGLIILPFIIFYGIPVLYYIINYGDKKTTKKEL